MGREGDAERIIFVDDSRRNISSCKPLGVECILFDRNSGSNLISLVEGIKSPGR
jgi:FMN phosphatase YigB (HAD superfamily)